MPRSSVAGPCAFAVALIIASPAWGAPITQDELVARALAHVPALEAAAMTARSQHTRLGVARSGYYPQVALGAGYARAANVPPAPFGAAAADGGTAQLSLHQELYNFGQTDALVAQASASAELADAQSTLAILDASYQVRQAYLQWLQALGLEARGLETVKNARTLRGQANSFFVHGVRPRIDLSRAEVVLQQAEADLADARSSVAIARRTLEAAVGGGELGGEPVFPPEPALLLQPLPRLESLAFKRHPLLQTSVAQERLALAARQIAERAGRPDLSANAIAGARAQELAFGPDWQAGLNLAWPLFTGYNFTSATQAAREGELAAEARLRDRVLQVGLGVDRAYLAIAGAREKLAAYRGALASARENDTYARNRYREGVGSIIEVSEAQTLLAGAQADLVRQQVSYHLAIAALQHAIGLTGLEPQAP